MKKKITYLMLVISGLCLNLKAQVSKEIISKYQASVVYRLYSITDKTPIPLEKQKILAEYFNDQEKLAKKAMISGASCAEIATFFTNHLSYIKSILSPLEFNDYLYDADHSTFKIVKALKFRSQLNLSGKQIDELLSEQQKITMNGFVETTSSAAYDDETICKTLNAGQYDQLLDLIIRPIAIKENQDAWSQLIRERIVTPSDSVNVYDRNLAYYVKSGIIDLRYAHKSNIKIDSVRGTYFAFKPFTLFKLDMLNENLPQSQFANILKDRKALVLSPKQIDSLISYAGNLEKQKLKYKMNNTYQKFDTTPFEAKGIIRTLEPSQYDTYLRNKNRANAMVLEKKKWTRLKQYGLSAGVDSAQVSRELINYELNVLVANERYHNDDSPQNTEIKKAAEHKKPLLYQKLEIAVSTTPANSEAKKALAW